MMNKVSALLSAIVCTAINQTAMAQTATLARPPVEQQPVKKGTVVPSEVEGTMVWRADDGEPFTLKTLAHYAAPIVWFSPDEPLLRAGASLPQPLPPLAGANPPTTPSRVYYNIPLLLIHDEDRCRPLVAKQYPPRAHPLGNEDLVWSDAQGAPVTVERPPLDCLDLVKIRFFFYYASEVGVSAHSNDFESLQINIRIKANQPTDGDSTECAVSPNDSGHCALVVGAYGSAHGIAWYTNGLNVTKNQDTLFPLTVLVEEGKHASAPDRNADGIYTPGFDVDIHPNDAWGIRDILRTRWLQGPAFRADMAKHRLERDRVYPPDPNGRVMSTWLDRTGYPGDAWVHTYALENIRTAIGGVDAGGQPLPYCAATGDQLRDEFRETRPRPGCNSGTCEPLEDLIRGEEGCRRTRVYPFAGWPKQRQTLAKVNIGGTHDEYLTWPRFFGERIAPGFRLSGTSRSVWWVPPVAWNVPGLDGWITARLNFRRHTEEDSPIDGPVDIVYSLSAARYISSYIALGRDTLPLTDANEPGGHRTALEAGLKWRFSIPRINIFSGVRVGLRADDPSHLQYPRVVIEVGGGSW